MKLSPPRNTLSGTRAEDLLRRDFYRVYLQARSIAGEDRELPDAASVFAVEGMRQLREHITEEALKAPVVLTERLSNRVLAVHLVQNAVERFVVLNVRFKVDPDVLAHALVEEYVHSQQVLDNLAACRRECWGILSSTAKAPVDSIALGSIASALPQKARKQRQYPHYGSVTLPQEPLADLQDMQAPQIVGQAYKTPLVGHVLLTA